VKRGAARARAFLVVGVVLAGSLVTVASASAQLMTVRDRRGRLVVVNTPASRPRSKAPAPVYAAAEISPRVSLFDLSIHRAASANGLSPRLIQAVIQVESGYDPRAVSNRGARGLMQLMPDTARDMGVADVFDPDQNIGGGARYLRLMLDTFDQDLTLALAAYNAGPDTVRRAGAVPAIPETRNYVRRINEILGLPGEAAPASYIVFQPGHAPSMAAVSTPALRPVRFAPTVDSWRDVRGVLHITNVGGRKR